MAAAAFFLLLRALDARAQYRPIPNYVGINAGQQFRNDINNHLSGATPIAPRLVTLSFLQLPAEADGQLYWCKDCQASTPCQGGGAGAMALGQGGAWTCGGIAPLSGSLNANGNRVINLAPNSASGDALSQGQSHLNDLAAATASYNMGANRLTNLAPDSSTGDALSRNQSALNSLAAATANYTMGGNKMTGLGAGSAAGDSLSYGQSGALLNGLNLNNTQLSNLPAAGAAGEALAFNQAGAQLTPYARPFSRGAATNCQTGNTSTLTCNKPANTQSGDLLVWCITAGASVTFTPPTGWTNIRLDGTSAGCWDKAAGASEPSSYTMTESANNYGSGVLMDLAQQGASPIDASAGSAGGASQTYTQPAPAVSTASDLMIVCAGNTTGFTLTSPSATLISSTSGASGESCWYYTGSPVSASFSSPVGYIGWDAEQIAVFPASGTPNQPLVMNQPGALLNGLSGSGAGPTLAGFNTDGAFNPVAYGADNTGSIAADGAIQSAYNAAMAAATGTSQPAVKIPAGTYLLTFPLVALEGSYGYNPVIGAGGLASTLKTNGKFPPIAVIPSTYMSSLGTISGPALVGTNPSLQFNSGKAWFLSLADVMANCGGPIGGLGAFTFEGFFKTTDSNGNTDAIVSSVNQEYNPTFELRAAVGGAFTAIVTVGGTKYTLGGGTVSANAVYFFALTYDGSNIRLYVTAPGGTNITPLATQAAAGTITEAANESLTLGGEQQHWPDDATLYPWVGNLQEIRISNTARYTGTIASVPNGALSGDSNTMLLIHPTSGKIAPAKNGLSSTPFVGIDWDNLNTSQVPNDWLTVWLDGYTGNTSGATVRDLGLSGGSDGVFLADSPGSTLKNLVLSSFQHFGLALFNNNYNSTLENIYANPAPSGCGQADFAYSWSVRTSRNLAATGGYYQFASAPIGFGTLINPIATGNSGTIANFYAQLGGSQFDEAQFIGAQCDNENGGNTIGLEVAPGSGGILVSQGSEWEGTGTGPAIQYDGATGPTSHFDNDLFVGGGSASEVINTPGAQVLLTNPYLPYGGTLTNNPQYVTTISAAASSFASAPALQAGLNHLNVNKVADPAAIVVSVAGAAGSTSYGPYYDVCHDVNGGVTNVSPISNTVANGPASLGSSNYISLALGTLPAGCATYDILKGNLTTALLTNQPNPGGAVTAKDVGQATGAYTYPTRNTTGDVNVGTMMVSSGISWPLPAAVVNGASFYCPNCDPPANPPAACTSSGAKTGSWVHGLNSQWVCTP